MLYFLSVSVDEIECERQCDSSKMISIYWMEQKKIIKPVFEHRILHVVSPDINRQDVLQREQDRSYRRHPQPPQDGGNGNPWNLLSLKGLRSKLKMLQGLLTLFAACLGEREPPRSAVDARKAPSSPNGHGLRPPFGRALLSMPVRLLRRPTGTASGRPSDRCLRGWPSIFAATREKAFSSIFPPKPTIASPARFYGGKSRKYEAARRQRQAERERFLSYLLRLFVNMRR